MSRALDLIAVAAVAIVVLFPKASIEAKPALVGEKIELDHIAELEDLHFANPADVGTAVELADAYLHLLHPDWALAALAPYGDAPTEPRVHLLRATAHAERLEAQAAVDDAERGKRACDASHCPDYLRIKLDVIAGPMRVLVEQHIDPHQDPKRAADAVSRVLHSAKPRPPSK